MDTTDSEPMDVDTSQFVPPTPQNRNTNNSGLFIIDFSVSWQILFFHFIYSISMI